MYRVQTRTQAQLDVIRSRNLIAELRDAAQLVFKVNDGQLTSKGCQIQRFLDRTVCTADDIDVLSGIRCAVARCVQAHALAGKLDLSGNAQLTGRTAVCQNDPACLMGSLVGVHGLDIPGQLYAGNRLISDFHARSLCLLLHTSSEGCAGFLCLQSGIMGDGRDLADDAADLRLLENQGLLAAADCIDACADTSRACTDNKDVIHNESAPSCDTWCICFFLI